jgi:hypothetical protein
MRSRLPAARLPSVIVLALAACVTHTSPQPPDQQGAPATPWLELFAAYPGARSVCSQHISGTPMHIVWRMYAAREAPDAVKAFYRKAHPSLVEEKAGAFDLRGPAEKLLSVHAVGERYPDCGQAPASDERTVLIVSQAFGRR